jgi:Txe/YoeB family toxin of Txe-Axe toxin-antitoxin module
MRAYPLEGKTCPGAFFRNRPSGIEETFSVKYGLGIDQISKKIKTPDRLFAKRIFKIIQDMNEFPMSGRVVPEYNNSNIREKIVENYRIVYRIKDDFLEIAVICHASKLLRL